MSSIASKKNTVVNKKQSAVATTSSSSTTTTSATTVKNKNNLIRGRLLLVLVAFLYGTLNVSLRQVYEMPNPPTAAALSACRGWLTAACFLPILLFQKNNNMVASSSQSSSRTKQSPPLWIKALEFSLWNCGSFGLLNVGLQKTKSATRASFLTQTSVVITPLLSLLAGQSVKSSVWLGCVMALLGVVTLSMGASSTISDAAASSSLQLYLSTGDLLVLAGACCWSAYLFRCSNLTSDDYPKVQLQGMLAMFRAVLYSLWFLSSLDNKASSSLPDALVSAWPGYRSVHAWCILIFSSMGPGALASVLLQAGQTEVSASEANVILCGEPVFTALCAWIVLGQETRAREAMGGLLILLAALLASGTFDGILSYKKHKVV